MAKKKNKAKEEEDIKEETGKDTEKESKPGLRKVVEEMAWTPRTGLGKRVASGEIRDVYKILDKGEQILEKEIIDTLLPDLESDLLHVGQAKGKFGGGKRRVFRQTQKKTKEGNKPRFAALAVVGNRDGIIGLGYGKSRETVPAREKATRNAKLNIFKIRRGSGSWESRTSEAHSIPFAVEGKSGSVIIKLIPAPVGTGLKCDREVARILELAGITDVWSKVYGQSRTKMNLIKATEKALKKLMDTKLQEHHYDKLSVAEGPTETSKKDVASAEEK